MHTHRGVVTKLTGARLSIGLSINFLSLNEMFLISLHGKPTLGVSLQETQHTRIIKKTTTDYVNLKQK